MTKVDKHWVEELLIKQDRLSKELDLQEKSMFIPADEYGESKSLRCWEL